MLNPALDYNFVSNVTRPTDTAVTSLATSTSSSTSYSNDLKLSTLETLKRLLLAHKHLTGWTVLIAPLTLPTKQWCIEHGLATERLLVIHAKQIRDLELTLQRAITSVSCRVVINCVPCKDIKQTRRLTSFAAKHNSFYYQYDRSVVDTLPH